MGQLINTHVLLLALDSASNGRRRRIAYTPNWHNNKDNNNNNTANFGNSADAVFFFNIIFANTKMAAKKTYNNNSNIKNNNHVKFINSTDVVVLHYFCKHPNISNKNYYYYFCKKSTTKSKWQGKHCARGGQTPAARQSVESINAKVANNQIKYLKK